MRETVYNLQCPNPGCESRKPRPDDPRKRLDIESVDIGNPDKSGNQYVLWFCPHCGTIVPVASVRS